MEKTIKLLHQEFESSTGRTPQYLTWHRTFKREMTKTLLDLGALEVIIFNPNHFDGGGFFRAPSGQIYYFSIGDLRWDKDSMLIRAAKSFKDYSGGQNQFISLATAKGLVAGLKRYTERKDLCAA